MGSTIENKAFARYNDPEERWKFSEIIADPEVRSRWEKVRKFFFLRESTYDMTRRCSIRCEGCYYFEGEKQFTKEKGVHNILEMSRFLKILGDQKIQITLSSMAKPILSWVIHTNENAVEYIDSISGKTTTASIYFDINLENFLSDKNVLSNAIKITLNDNKRLKANLNLMRFLAASLSEVLVYYKDQILKTIVYNVLAITKIR